MLDVSLVKGIRDISFRFMCLRVIRPIMFYCGKLKTCPIVADFCFQTLFLAVHAHKHDVPLSL